MRPLILTSSVRFPFVDDLLLCLKHLFFGLEPIVELRARLITLLDVEFVGSSPDSLFEWKRFDLVMDHFTRRIIGFGVHRGGVDGEALCAGCFSERCAVNVCQNTSARITIRYTSSINGKPIFEYSR